MTELPLVLSLRQGQDFYVADEQLVVADIESATSFFLLHIDSKTGKKKRHKVNDIKAKQILPNVWMSAGERPEAQIVRLSIDAPRDLLIIRGDKRRNPPPEFVILPDNHDVDVVKVSEAPTGAGAVDRVQ